MFDVANDQIIAQLLDDLGESRLPLSQRSF
jgi:hypothetical protein